MAFEKKLDLNELDLRISELELQLKKIKIRAPGGLAAFSAGDCTNGCTDACTRGCTNGCTGGNCLLDPGSIGEDVIKRG
jgi:hypothetical protein